MLLSIVSIAANAVVALTVAVISAYNVRATARITSEQTAESLLFSSRLSAYAAFMAASSDFIGEQTPSNLSRLHAAMRSALLVASENTDAAIRWYYDELNAVGATSVSLQQYSAASQAAIRAMQADLQSFRKCQEHNLRRQHKKRDNRNRN